MKTVQHKIPLNGEVFCIRCARKLHRPVSRLRGIGKSCQAKLKVSKVIDSYVVRESE